MSAALEATLRSGAHALALDLSEAQIAQLLEFIGLLRKYRRRQPINGVIITISISDLLTLSPEDELLRDPDGTLAVRLCNFELLRRLD